MRIQICENITEYLRDTTKLANYKLFDIDTNLSTSFPGSYLFLPRERTLIVAGHVTAH